MVSYSVVINMQCEHCQNYLWDEEEEYNFCNIDLDMDEMERFLNRAEKGCPYFKYYDEYTMVRKQN